MSDIRYWIALSFLPDIGPVLARRLLSEFGTPDILFQASAGELMGIEGIGNSRIRSIGGFRQWDRVEKEIEECEKSGVRLVTLHDPEYPPSLKNIPDAPLLLYLRGGMKEEDRYAVAIVGSRLPTPYGLRFAEQMGSQLASYGLTVVSGMARGVDAAAHRGTLKAKGRTVAVLGSGIDVPYPAENRGLMNGIASAGAVISEFPLATQPNRENFPRRNRIISALSLGVVVVEAAVDSGSLITVRYALEQGKEVFALPGNVTSRNSRGTNKLIKEGAKLVESAEEVIDELASQIRGILKEKRLTGRPLPEMNGDEEKLYHYLDSEPKHIDAIVRGVDLPSGKVLSVLLNLELKGVVRQLEGKLFSLN